MAENEFLPCPNPWCESHKYGREGAPTREDVMWLSGTESRIVGCAYCNLQGPISKSEDEAIANWNARGSTGWQPRIGDEVRASESFLSLYSEWRDVPLFVAGICKDRGTPGLNVSVSEKWPVDSRSDGYTDGFYIGRDHCPDDIVPATGAMS